MRFFFHHHQLWCLCVELSVSVCVCLFSFVYRCRFAPYVFAYQFKIKCNWFYFDMSFNHSSEKITQVAYFKEINVHSKVRSLGVVHSRSCQQWLNWRHIFSPCIFFWHELVFSCYSRRIEHKDTDEKKKWWSESLSNLIFGELFQDLQFVHVIYIDNERNKIK